MKLTDQTKYYRIPMRLIQFLLLLFLISCPQAFAQEGSSFSIFQKLQGLGINLGQNNPQELLPPDEAFKISVEVRDGQTLIAHLTPAKDYYLYRDKITFEPKQEGLTIEKVTLPPGQMKDDMTFGQMEVYFNPIQAIISLKRTDSASEQPLTLEAGYQGCNEPVGVCYAPIHKVIELTLPAVAAAIGAVADAVSNPAVAADATAELFQMPSRVPAIETESYKIERMFERWRLLADLASFRHWFAVVVYTVRVSMFPILSGIIANRGKHMPSGTALFWRWLMCSVWRLPMPSPVWQPDCQAQCYPLHCRTLGSWVRLR